MTPDLIDEQLQEIETVAHRQYAILLKAGTVLALVAMARRSLHTAEACKIHGHLGGLAAAASMTSEERVARARKAAQARWSKEAPDGR